MEVLEPTLTAMMFFSYKGGEEDDWPKTHFQLILLHTALGSNFCQPFVLKLLIFCILSRGRRRWSIENSFVSAAEELRREVPNCDTRLITDFRVDQSWELEQGDVLYLPPRVPHQGDLNTFSLPLK